jgi:hypothetical protein
MFIIEEQAGPCKDFPCRSTKSEKEEEEEK